MKRSARIKNNRGFTLVELLVVIAIIAILAIVVFLIINPIELFKRSRDATRLTDLANLQNAINVTVEEYTGTGSPLCNGGSGPCSGASTDGGGAEATFKNDGTGWVKVNLSAQKTVTLPFLPRDPVNNSTYHYTYATNNPGTAYEIDAVLESDQQSPKMAQDGGNNDNVYEVGTDLTILP